jgi:hypothetical protein
MNNPAAHTAKTANGRRSGNHGSRSRCEAQSPPVMFFILLSGIVQDRIVDDSFWTSHKLGE